MQPQNKTTNKRRMALLSTLYGCLIYPVTLMLGLIISVQLGGPGSNVFTFVNLVGMPRAIIYVGILGLLTGPVVGLLIGLFIEFKRTGSLWRAAGGGVLIGLIVTLFAESLLGEDATSEPVGTGLRIASILAAMATALAVGLALRYRP
jgi:hypothetical protein